MFVFWYALVAVLFVFRDGGAYEQTARLQQLFNNRFGPDPSAFVVCPLCPSATGGERYRDEGDVRNETIVVFDEVLFKNRRKSIPLLKAISNFVYVLKFVVCS